MQHITVKLLYSWVILTRKLVEKGHCSIRKTSVRLKLLSDGG